MMDELSHFVRSTFSSDRLVRAAPEVVVPLRIPDRSKQFLVTVGLPRAIDFVGGITLRFDLLDRLPNLRQLFPEHADRIDPGWDDCRFLALAPNEYDAGFVLNQADGGSIWSVTLDSTRSDFVNTSVEQFAWFIARWTKWATSSPAGKSRELLYREIDKMEQEMQSTDPRAMADEGIYWPAIIEDARLYT
jgi:hypothetical protein